MTQNTQETLDTIAELLGGDDTAKHAVMAAYRLGEFDGLMKMAQVEKVMEAQS